ncbi:hypothetical protein SLEP1_g30957 [Rubroshorea leprosula]|uniref:Uncharacterized protein n=1 Tax=Rubroshorea leprosula TaxID=152421 RepID=A0AAV5KAN3_9ROSI|nr:hypothetical protein SLEP1_g30957 [Rubroshorea leprosula]
MAGTHGRFRRKLKTLRRMKVTSAATKAEMTYVRQETAQMAASMEDIKFEHDLLKASLHQQFNDMLLVSEAVDNLTQIILQL